MRSIFTVCRKCGTNYLTSQGHSCRIKYNKNPFKKPVARQAVKKQNNPYGINLDFGKGVLGGMDFGFPKGGIMGGSNSIDINKKAQEGRALLRQDYNNLKRVGQKLRNIRTKGTGVYYVVTERDGVIIRHNFNHPNKAKQFKELAEASGSYNRVSNSVNEQP